MALRRWLRIEGRQRAHQAYDLLSLRRFVAETQARGRLKRLLTKAVSFRLNGEQRAVAASLAKETLVVAGAGTGKTSVLLGRSQFLVAEDRSRAEDILILAFNRRAAEEVRERAELLALPVRARTFHGFALDLLKQGVEFPGASSDLPYQNLRQLKSIAFSSDDELRQFLDAELASLARTNRGVLDFFAYQMVPERSYEEFKTIQEYSRFVRTGIPITLNGETVKSHGEWLIANRLYALGVPYAYEQVYGDGRDAHRPDFTVDNRIIIEYFGIDADGSTAPGVDRDRYHQSMAWKQELHKRNKSSFVALYYHQLREGTLLADLDAALHRLKIQIRPRSPEELLARANQIGYFSQFSYLLMRALGFMRAAHCAEAALWVRPPATAREHMFVSIAESLYHSYMSALHASGSPDFTGLIGGAAQLLRAHPTLVDFKHVMVDEFQDISRDRWHLMTAIAQADPSVDFTFVGDDWQAINEFAGSDPRIMLRLSNFNRQRKQVTLKTTFRMPQDLCEATGTFVMANESQIPKTLRSHQSSQAHQPSLHVHWNTTPGDHEANIASVIATLGKVAQDPELELLVLARYNRNLPDQRSIDALWAGPVQTLTIHKAKGLEADFVIVTDVDSVGRGFPSLINDDPLLDLARSPDSSYPHAAERRVFYVALSRARQQTHVISPAAAPSIFAEELKSLKLGQHQQITTPVLTCPVCKAGSIIASQQSARCSNAPVCAFRSPVCPTCRRGMTLTASNNPKYLCADHPETAPAPCPTCKVGALVERNGKFGPFLSCHLWPQTQCPGPKNSRSRSTTRTAAHRPS